jgi:hypothetical protein
MEETISHVRGVIVSLVFMVLVIRVSHVLVDDKIPYKFGKLVAKNVE